MHWYSKSWAPLAAFLIIAVVGGWALYSSTQGTTDTIYKGQLAACDRGNVLRAESNRRVEANNTEVDVLRTFLLTAREARRAAGKPLDLVAASEYTILIRRLETVKFKPVDIVNCIKTIPKP